MSGYSYDEDWVHIDDYEKEVKELNDEVYDLKEEIEARKDNEVFRLSEMMLIRDALLSGKPVSMVLDDMQQLIATHAAEVREQATAKLVRGEFYEA